MLKQLDDISQLEDANLLLFEVIFAIIFLIIVILRYLYMRHQPTFVHSVKSLPKAHILLVKTIHLSMYWCFIILPLSGLLIALLFSLGMKDGWMQNFAIGLHEFSASLSYVLIGVHITGAFYSRIKGEGVWSSMVPVWNKERPTSNKLIPRLISLEVEFFNRSEKFFSKFNKWLLTLVLNSTRVHDSHLNYW